MVGDYSPVTNKAQVTLTDRSWAAQGVCLFFLPQECARRIKKQEGQEPIPIHLDSLHPVPISMHEIASTYGLDNETELGTLILVDRPVVWRVEYICVGNGEINVGRRQVQNVKSEGLGMRNRETNTQGDSSPSCFPSIPSRSPVPIAFNSAS